MDTISRALARTCLFSFSSGKVPLSRRQHVEARMKYVATYGRKENTKFVVQLNLVRLNENRTFLYEIQQPVLGGGTAPYSATEYHSYIEAW